MKLITESNFDILTEAKEKDLYVTGIFSTADAKNQNGRVYPKHLLEREIGKLQEQCKDKTLIGELSHPQDRAESSFKEAAILTESLVWDGNNVIGKSKVLSTPSGFILRGLINDGVKIGISSRALGDVNESGEVKDSLKMITWDIVQSPSNHGSWINGILENCEFEKVLKNEITEKDIKEAKDYHFKRIWQVLENL